jgi:hypothetical protein
VVLAVVEVALMLAVAEAMTIVKVYTVEVVMEALVVEVAQYKQALMVKEVVVDKALEALVETA